MNTLTRLKIALTALTLGLALLPAAQAQQAVKFPAGLKWEVMKFGAFAPGGMMKESASPAEKKLALELWKSELNAMPPNKFFDRSKGEYPADFLISTYENDKYKFVFSIMYTLHMDYPACSDPLNGPFPPGFDFNNAQMQHVCPMRMVRMDKASRQTKQWTLKDYCAVHSDYSEEHAERKNHPVEENHTEIAIHGDTAYFRVIQFGRQATRCDRAVQLQ